VDFRSTRRRPRLGEFTLISVGWRCRAAELKTENLKLETSK